jgi:hypothetical protein
VLKKKNIQRGKKKKMCRGATEVLWPRHLIWFSSSTQGNRQKNTILELTISIIHFDIVLQEKVASFTKKKNKFNLPFSIKKQKFSIFVFVFYYENYHKPGIKCRRGCKKKLLGFLTNKNPLSPTHIRMDLFSLVCI